MPDPASPTSLSWVPALAAFVFGFLAWGVPIAAFWVAYFFAMGQHEFGLRELLMVAGAVAVLVFGGPIWLMYRQQWYPAAIAYAVGGLVGVAPLVALVTWFLSLGAGRH